MRDRPKRGLTLLDAMILVAATAPGLALTRHLSHPSYRPLLRFFAPSIRYSPR